MSTQRMFGLALILVGLVWVLYFGIPALQDLQESQKMKSQKNNYDAGLYAEMAKSEGIKSMLGVLFLVVGIGVISSANKAERKTSNLAQHEPLAKNQEIILGKCSSCGSAVPSVDAYCAKCGAKQQ